MTLEAFSEDHLKTLYFNPLLEQMEDFVEHFIKVWVNKHQWTLLCSCEWIACGGI